MRGALVRNDLIKKFGMKHECLLKKGARYKGGDVACGLVGWIGGTEWRD